MIGLFKSYKHMIFPTAKFQIINLFNQNTHSSICFNYQLHKLTYFIRYINSIPNSHFSRSKKYLPQENASSPRSIERTLGLANKTSVPMVASGIIPPPVEDPDHLSTVFVSFPIVWFPDVPVEICGVRSKLVSTRSYPFPRTRRPVSDQPDPEIAVSGFCKKHYSFEDICFVRNKTSVCHIFTALISLMLNLRIKKCFYIIRLIY